MAYHMRFLDTSAKPLTLAAIEAALRVSDPAYRLEQSGDPLRPQARLSLGEVPHGELAINTPGDGVFEAVLKELQERLAKSDNEFREAVEATLTSAKRIIGVRVSVGEDELDNTLDAIDPLWDWLFDSRTGLLHAEGEGFYEDGEMILEEE